MRVLPSPIVRGDQDRIAPIVELGELHLSRLTRLGTGGHERCCNDYAQGCG